ncbi:MAG: transporter substrate-binding domain-containing protein [Verrucomicrobia bacterium]|nr:transporter substrate-binding domain-containing protein [Verrucomicrobiota bacterium]
MKKLLVSILSTLLGIGIFVLPSFFSSKDEDALVIGLQSGYPPFEFRDAAGEIVGFDVELGKRIAQELGKKAVFHDMEFDGEILSLQQGKIDLILSGMNITSTRLQEISMVPYHGESVTSLTLLFWKKVPEGVSKLEDISGVIAVETGSIAENYLKKIPGLQLKTFVGSLEPLIDVKYGKSAACVVQPDVGAFLLKEHPDFVALSIPLPPEEHVLGFGIGVSKENTQLLEQVSSIVADLKQTGELQQLEKEWFGGVP